MTKPIDVSFVIPCYRSGQVLRKMVRGISELCETNLISHEIILVEDCTPDNGETWKELKLLNEEYAAVKSLRLARNVGQQLAVICGFEHSIGESVITLDDDGQHDIQEVIPMLDALKSTDVVIASFEQRKVGVVRALGTTVVRYLAMKVFNLNRGLSFSSFRAVRGEIARSVPKLASTAPVVGFELLNLTSRVKNYTVRHNKRAAGESTYSVVALVKYFSSMVLGYSNFLPRACVYMSLSLGMMSMLLALYYLFQYFSGTLTQPGFATLAVLISASFSVVMIMLSAIASQLAKLGRVAQGVPRYIVSRSS